MSDDLIKAAFIMVDVTAVETDRIRGVISEDPEAGGARLQVMTEGGSVCVDVPATARIFAVMLDDGDGLGSSKPIDRSDLRRGDQLSIFGVEGETAGDCFTAETVIAFIDAEPAALPSTAFAPSEATATADALDFDEEPFDEEVDDSAASGDVEVYDILPGRHAEGLVWVKLRATRTRHRWRLRTSSRRRNRHDTPANVAAATATLAGDEASEEGRLGVASKFGGINANALHLPDRFGWHRPSIHPGFDLARRTTHASGNTSSATSFP